MLHQHQVILLRSIKGRLPGSSHRAVMGKIEISLQVTVGKYHIQVCKTLSCKIRGSSTITEHCAKKFGIKPGETTADGRFTLSEVECLGSCGTAPMFQLNFDYHENLTAQKVDQILDALP